MSDKYKKQPIPQKIRIEVWKKYNGNSFEGFCFSCKDPLKFENFHAGHILAEKNGGSIDLENLLPICSSCNISCGRKNLEKFSEHLKVYKRKFLKKSFGKTLKSAYKKLQTPVKFEIKNLKDGSKFEIKNSENIYEVEIEKLQETFCCFEADFYSISLYSWNNPTCDQPTYDQPELKEPV